MALTRQMVFEYGLLQPTMGGDVVADQISKAHRYYNQLIEIERERRSAIRAAQNTVPEIARLNVEIDDLRERKKKWKARKKESKSSDKRVAPPDPAEAKAINARLKEARAEVSLLKKEHAVPLKKLYEEADFEAERKSIEARAEASKDGLYWGTYLQIEQAVDLAKKSTSTPTKVLKSEQERARRNPHRPIKIKPWEMMPNFRRWDGDGLVAVQIQGGMTANPGKFSIFGSDRRLQIDPLDDHAFDKSVTPSRGQRKRLQRTKVRLRVGSEGRDPIWAEWPLFMHRPLPDGAIVKWAKVIRREWRQNFRYRWWLQLTVEVPEVAKWEGKNKHGEMVAVNLGWRKMWDGTLRVATWVDDSGRTGSIHLPKSFRDRIERSRELQSMRDEKRNELQEWLVGHGISECSEWKSPKRFHWLLADLKRKNSEGERVDAEVARLTEWAYRDNHLWWYQRGCHKGALRYRRQVYRLLARDIANSYPFIVAEKYDIREIAEKEDRESGPSRQRVEGSPSEARHQIKAAASRLGCTIITAEHELATQECHLCGYGRQEDERWDAAPSVMHTCNGCGAEWDQDINNARVMLARAKVALEREGVLAFKKEKKHARFHKKHAKVAETVV